MCDLYLGDPERCLARTERHAGLLADGQPELRIQACILAHVGMAAAGVQKQEHLDEVGKLLAEYDALGTDGGVSSAQQLLVRAGCTYVAGDKEEAMKLLALSSAEHEVGRNPLFPLCAERRLGELEGGISGRERIERADRRLTECGVGKPAVLVACFTPGFGGPQH